MKLRQSYDNHVIDLTIFWKSCPCVTYLYMLSDDKLVTDCRWLGLLRSDLRSDRPTYWPSSWWAQGLLFLMPRCVVFWSVCLSVSCLARQLHWVPKLATPLQISWCKSVNTWQIYTKCETFMETIILNLSLTFVLKVATFGLDVSS